MGRYYHPTVWCEVNDLWSAHLSSTTTPLALSSSREHETQHSKTHERGDVTRSCACIGRHRYDAAHRRPSRASRTCIWRAISRRHDGSLRGGLRHERSSRAERDALRRQYSRIIRTYGPRLFLQYPSSVVDLLTNVYGMQATTACSMMVMCNE